MEDLLKVSNIVNNVVLNLNTRDYLNFKCINQTTYKTRLGEESDYKYFSRKLRQSGLKEDTQEAVEDNQLIDDTSHDVSLLNIYQELPTFTRKNYLTIFRTYYRVFDPYCQKLSNNKLTDFFPSPYDRDPLQQSKILQNIIRYNKSNSNAYEYYNKVVVNFEILKEIFINSCLNEMEINFSSNNYEIVGNFMHILLTFNEQNVAIDFFNSKIEFPTVSVGSSKDTDGDQEMSNLSEEGLQQMFKPLKDFLNEWIGIIDHLFHEDYPMAINFYETFLQQSLLPLINELLKGPNDPEIFVERFPLVYKVLIQEFCDELVFSNNGSMAIEASTATEKEVAFRKKIFDLLNVYLEPNVLEYLDQSNIQFEKNVLRQFSNFQMEQRNKTETERMNISAENSTRDLQKDELKDGDKNTFLDSFTKVFGITNKASKSEQMNDNLSNLINNSLRNIKNLINLELCLSIIRQTQDRIDVFLQFKTAEKLNTIVNEKCEDIFTITIKCLNEYHVKPAYEKAISLLQSYDINELPIVDDAAEGNENNNRQSLEPLINFSELINTSDIILQMISIFYRNELVTKKIINPETESKKNVWQSGLLQEKKNFESTVDNFVADGLNIGINKLVDQINHVFTTVQVPSDYFPAPDKRAIEIKPTQCCREIVTILNNHCFLLNGATDKGTIDVYQQEIGKRFFNVLVEHIKKQIISTQGAIILICDMNQYFDFFNEKLRQKSIIPYFQALKNVSNLYLIDGKDSKDLGKLIGDLNKFQGIFSQEEIYELVQRRQDWTLVKRDVEKVMYGLGLRDCTIM